MPDFDEAYERIESAALRLGRKAIWEESNRVGLLRVHGWTGVFVGAQIFAHGAAANIEEMFGVWSRSLLGSWGMVGGLVLLVGVHRRGRGGSILQEATGLVMLGLWDLALMLGFLVARVQAGNYAPRSLFEPLPPPGTYVLPYPIGIYAGLFALICVHLWTLRRFRRGR